MRLPFFEIDCVSDAPAMLQSNGPSMTYGELCHQVDEWQGRLAHEVKQLVFCYLSNSPQGVMALIGALAAGHAVALLDANLSTDARIDLEELYRPWVRLVPASDGSGPHTVERTDYAEAAAGAINPAASVLLSTSGSTGSPKFVRLTKQAVLSNARAIATALEITDADIGLGHLEVHYSYGLSIVTSHFVRGAAVGFPSGKFTDRGFWDDVRALEATHIPGVPFHHEIMHRLGLQRLKLPSLRVLTQAGGRLSLPIQQAMHEAMEELGGRFYVMYGQTEAAPRMTTLSHEDFARKPGSVGQVLDGGTIEIVDDGGGAVAAGETGEVVYSGPNVMLGYAFESADLGRADESNGVLRTGDVGHLDEEGFLYVTGRSSRMGKVYGWRVNLDEIEQFCEGAVPMAEEFAAVQIDEKIHLVALGLDQDERGKLATKLAQRFALPSRVFAVGEVAAIPKNARNKTDYSALKAELTC